MNRLKILFVIALLFSSEIRAEQWLSSGQKQSIGAGVQVVGQVIKAVDDAKIRNHVGNPFGDGDVKVTPASTPTVNPTFPVYRILTI